MIIILKEGYDNEYLLDGLISIRFRNSGSRYAPFNRLFMKMFNKLQFLDDVNDYGHQIHIEEYLYNNKRPVVAIIGGSGISIKTTLKEFLERNIELPEIKVNDAPCMKNIKSLPELETNIKPYVKRLNINKI